MPNISTNAGPITFNNNVITALDWYGNKLWNIDMKSKVSDQKINMQVHGKELDLTETIIEKLIFCEF